MEQSNNSTNRTTNWRFRQEQAQADINRFVGLRSSLSSIGHSSKSGNRFCRRIHFRLLRRTIRDKYALLSVVDNNIRIYDWNLRSFNLGSRFYQNFYIHAKKLALKAFKVCEWRLRRKFKKLKIEMRQTKHTNSDMDIITEAALHKRKVVWNLRRIEIPPETEELIGNLVMNFQFAPKKFPALEIIQSTELVCQRIENYQSEDQRIIAINKERAQKIRSIVVSHIQKNCFKKIKQNTTQRQMKLLEDFQDIPDMVRISADKGTAIVCENTQEYIRKEDDLLNDMDVEISQKTEKQLIQRTHKRLIDAFNKMKMKWQEYRKFTVTAPELPKLYIPIKTHKADFPGRPVLSQINDPTYNICKELTRILLPIAMKGRSFIKDSYSLQQKLKQLDIGDHLIQISYDIHQLYPSIPVQDTLNITHLELINDNTLKERTKWKPKQIINLLEVCIEETHFYDFQVNIWTQTDGLAIGKSISGALTDIYMNWYEEEYIFNPTRNSFIPFCWERQKDDVYCLWQFDEENHKKFLLYLNTNEKRIQWTQETEKEKTLTFLDMKLTRFKNTIQIGIYRKKSHTLKYSSYDSYRPRNEQMGILKNMLYRAYNLCDPGPEREEEIKTLNFAFINQNYPPKEVLKTIQSYQESDGNKEDNKRAEERTESIVVPYIKGVSEKLRKDLGKEDINVVFKRGKTLHSMIFNGKFKKSDGRKKDLIYKIPCRDCSLCYIGETAQWYDERETA